MDVMVKLEPAPDRIKPIGLAVRSITSAFAGAALAPNDQRLLGAAIAEGTALVSSYIGWQLRMSAMQRYWQTPTGLVEDAVVLVGGMAIANPRFAEDVAIRHDRYFYLRPQTSRSS